MRTQISDYELITFFNNLKEIIQAQKELNHVLAKRITNLENRLEKKERERIRGINCLSCKTRLTMDYRNKFNSDYCGDC